MTAYMSDSKKTKKSVSKSRALYAFSPPSQRFRHPVRHSGCRGEDRGQKFERTEDRETQRPIFLTSGRNAGAGGGGVSIVASMREKRKIMRKSRKTEKTDRLERFAPDDGRKTGRSVSLSSVFSRLCPLKPKPLSSEAGILR
jgi:hypothetical protein